LHIAAAANVEVPAYLTLKQKGFSVSCQESVWSAAKGELAFTGNGPIELLGLVAVFETRGASWKASDEEIEAFLEAFPQD
jgi:hypothetical protein